LTGPSLRPIFAFASKSHLQGTGVETSMYVCICRAIREREVDAAVRAGARRPSDIFRACGTRPQCGTCACDMRQRIAQTTAHERSIQQTVMASD
jgi:bacterioferritin-associated ferredoxin